MAQQTINNGDSGLSARTKINDNFTETYAKQDALVSGTNIKTVNGSSILGAGDLAVTSIIALSLLLPTLDQTITANYGAYVPEYYEIAVDTFLELGDGGIFEIG